MVLSYKLLSVFGIRIELHWSFIAFIIALLLFSPLVGVLLLVVFAFVTMHELCHAFVAKKYNIKVKKIILLPIGGVAVMNASRLKPLKEIKMAMAGPLFNFAVFLLALLFLKATGISLMSVSEVLEAKTLSIPLVLYYVLYANFMLGAFNLFLPAFPLDGGRIFRALLAFRMPYLKATLVARNVSLFIAGTLAFISLIMLQDLWLLIISFFIILGAVSEYEGLLIQTLLSRMKVKHVLSKEFIKVKPLEVVDEKIPLLFKKKELSVIVTTRPLSVADVRDVQSRGVVFSSIAKKVKPLKPNDSAEKALHLMEENAVSIVPVVSGNRLTGVVKRVDLEKARILVQLFGNNVFKS